MQWSSICLIRSNAAALGPRAHRFADDFLERFVQACPEFSPLMAWTPEERQRALLDTFTALMKQASNSQALSTKLLSITVANERRGIRAHHYYHGRDIMLALLAEYNGPAWAPALAGAWNELLDHVVIQLAPPQSFEEALAA